MYRKRRNFAALNIEMSQMESSRNNELIEVYQSDCSVFTLSSLMMLTGATDAALLTGRLNYQVRKGRLLNPRRGIYCKPDYKAEELCGQLYRPSYISLEHVLQKAGVVFQYDSTITAASYLSRELEIDGKRMRYRKMKPEILGATDGILLGKSFAIATPERALLDLMYLESNYYFDNPRPLNYQKIKQLLPIYNCRKLEQRVAALFNRK